MTPFCGAAGARAATTEGRLDEDDLDRLIETHRGRVALVTVSGASNVTGFVPPIHRLARKAHAAGARLLVVAARLAAHRPINVKPDDDPEHLDFVVLSGHKMYAPFGTGALVGAKEVFQGAPEYQGGGTVDVGKVIDLSGPEWSASVSPPTTRPRTWTPSSRCWCQSPRGGTVAHVGL